MTTRDPFGEWTPNKRALWLCVAALVFVFAGVDLARVMTPPPGVVPDFYQEWSSAKNAMTGRPAYAPVGETLEPYLGIRLRPNEKPYWGINLHPPTASLLAVPLVWLEFPTAMLVWNLVSLLLLALSLLLVVRALEVRVSPWSLLPLSSVLLVFEPLVQQVAQGQLNLVLLALIVGAWAIDRRGRPLVAGALVGAAAAVKLFPAFLLLYFVVRRRWWAIVGAAAAVVLLTIITAMVLGVDAYVDYVTKALPTRQDWLGTLNNASLTGLWHKLFLPTQHGATTTPVFRSTTLAHAGAALSSLFVVWLCAARTWRARTRTEHDLAFASTITGMLLVSPTTWEHYFLLLLLPLALAWLELPPTRPARLLLATVVIVMALPIIWLLDGFIAGGFSRGVATLPQTLTLVSMQSYALLALFALTGGWPRSPPAPSARPSRA